MRRGTFLCTSLTKRNFCLASKTTHNDEYWVLRCFYALVGSWISRQWSPLQGVPQCTGLTLPVFGDFSPFSKVCGGGEMRRWMRASHAKPCQILGCLSFTHSTARNFYLWRTKDELISFVWNVKKDRDWTHTRSILLNALVYVKYYFNYTYTLCFRINRMSISNIFEGKNTVQENDDLTKRNIRQENKIPVHQPQFKI